MTYLQFSGLLIFALVLWRVAKRLTAEKSSLANVAGPAKEHWLKGNYHRIFQDGLQYNLQLAEKYGGAVKIHALLGDEQLYVSDPRALHHIVVKEQHVYEETDMFIMGNKLIFGEGLIATLGEQHRKQRKLLNPVFSLGNMRELLPVIQPIADRLRTVLVSQLPADGGTAEINVLLWMSRGALEYIGQAGLGYSFNALDVSRSNEYTEAVRNLGPTVLRLLLLRPFIPVVVRNFSLYWRNKIIDWSPIKALKDLRQIVEVMDKSSKRILSEKRTEMRHGKDTTFGNGTTTEEKLIGRTRGKDVMSIMLKANADSTETDRLTEGEILGQMNAFIFAGSETTATALSRLLYILSERPEVQTRLRNEVRNAKRDQITINGILEKDDWKSVELPYDVLMGLPYLDAIVRETLRVHPPSSLFGRTVRKATTLPLEFPVRSVSGAEISSIPLRANTNIIISILAANHNKQIWGEDASVWRPERWLTSSGERIGFGKDIDGALGDGKGDSQGGAEGTPGNKDGVKYPGVYASMMTFLGGGRACIGFKFAEMEMKQVLVTLLSNLHFSLPPTKKIYWKMNGLQVPVVRAPEGDHQTPQVPLNIRLVRDEDFM